MKVLFPLLATVLLFTLAGCGNMLDEDLSKQGKGAVVTYASYIEYTPYRMTPLNKTRMLEQSLHIRAFFKNRETGKKYLIGNSDLLFKPTSPYAYSSLPPGHYDLHSWNIGVESHIDTVYDSASCGNIGFDIGPNDLVFIKGIRPLTIRQGLGKSASLIKFSYMPKDLKARLSKMYPDLASRNLKIPQMQSDNPEAFKRCVQRYSTTHKTLSGRDGDGTYIVEDPEEISDRLPFFRKK
ncbi:MAG: hypothetical protein K0R10_468 [Alphaproteobacteria bacterium]|nr:hypothetical protein [Alphaproteobacteria bacterium]